MPGLNFKYLNIYNIDILPSSIRSLPKYVQNFAKYLTDPLFFCQSRLKICLSGEISPNLVTLININDDEDDNNSSS